MKHTLLFISACALAWSLSSCNSCSKKQEPRMEQVLEFQNTLSHEDTTTMLRLCDNAMELLKSRQFDKVLDSLYLYDDSTKQATPLTEQARKEYTKVWTMFPVLEYQRVYFSFQLEGCNDVKYKVTWAKAEQAGTEEDPTTSYMFNPVKVDGTWKLCVKTLKDELDPNRQ